MNAKVSKQKRVSMQYCRQKQFRDNQRVSHQCVTRVKIKRTCFNGELEMSAKRTTMGHYTPKYPRLDERLLDWFTEQRSQDKFSFYMIINFNTVTCDEFVYQSREWEILIDFEDGLPDAMMEMFDMEFDFPPRTHCLSRWYGLKEFLVISPAEEAEVVDNESKCHLLLSSIGIAATNSKCTIPMFAHVRQRWRKIYYGLCIGGGFRTVYEIAHLRHVPMQYRHLAGLLEIFKDKLACPISPMPPVTLTVRFTYVLDEWTDYSWPQEPPDLSSCLECKVGVNDLGTLPFGACQDPIRELHLSTTWPCLSEEVIVDNSVYSDLDPCHAPQWCVRARMNDNPQCLLGEYLGGYLTLCHRQESTMQLLNKTVMDSDSDVADITHALQRLTEAPHMASLSTAVSRATSRISAMSERSSEEFPIPGPLLHEILKHLFPDADRDLDELETEQQELMFNKMEGSKDAEKPQGSQMLNCCIERKRVSKIRAASVQFCANVGKNSETRTSKTEDTSSDNLRKRNSDSPTERIEMQSSVSDDEEFFEAVESQEEPDDEIENNSTERKNIKRTDTDLSSDTTTNDKSSSCKREGAKEPFGELKLLVSGEPLLVPFTQEPPPMTEDMLEEQAEILTQLGTSEEGARVRAQMQCASLLSDMEAFKNLRKCLENTVSSEDSSEEGWDTEDIVILDGDILTTETSNAKILMDEAKAGKVEELQPPCKWREEGHLSLRMRIPGNMWVEVWQSARPVPVRRQKRLFDETKEAEKEFVKQLQLSELAITRAHSLRFKFRDALSEQDRYHGDKDVEQFLSALTEKPEVAVIGAGRGPAGRVIHRLFAKQETARMQFAVDEDTSSNLSRQPAPPAQDFPPPTGREYILRTTIPRPRPSSRPCPQRMYCVLTNDDFRLAGAFTDDVIFQ
ncbi:Rab3 GTPase-activating protein catalytic subunit [Stylophora pistillata]|uniref:Rab3 GTPase-activating protein catalytic subunit n=1 Tax=Stylophora pistillata TaxID=50429 RepID=A0A2B4RV55_STYPI|nr:Rab3 GTPase-activating protein catalytic subunit [Stylophora pistillata]